MEACARFVTLHFFRLKSFYFCVSLYKELLHPKLSARLTVLDNLCEVFGCSAITDVILIMFGFSKVFGCNYF